VTVAAFFAAHAQDGRAVVAGGPDRPRLWLAALEGFHFVLCRAQRPELTILHPETPMPQTVVITAQHFAPCACWFCDAYARRNAA
jgi:hypothetical protein